MTLLRDRRYVFTGGCLRIESVVKAVILIGVVYFD